MSGNLLLVALETQGNLELLSFGGSMAAMLKLKGIDGKAPQGVENAA